jgi:hypothetical protein
MFSRFLHPSDQPFPDASAAPHVRGIRSAEDGLEDRYLPDTHGIEVEEVSAVEFLREWGRAIARVALAISTKNIDKGH